MFKVDSNQIVQTLTIDFHYTTLHYIMLKVVFQFQMNLSNSLESVVRPSVRLSFRPAKSLLGPKGPSPPLELERSPP